MGIRSAIGRVVVACAVAAVVGGGCARDRAVAPALDSTEAQGFSLPIGSVLLQNILDNEVVYSVWRTPSGALMVEGPGRDRWTELPAPDPTRLKDFSEDDEADAVASPASGSLGIEQEITEARVEYDRAKDWARVTMTVPGTSPVVDRLIATPYPVEVRRTSNPDRSATMECEGTINGVLGTMMHLGMKSASFRQALLGRIDIRFDQESSTVAGWVNGVAAPPPYNAWPVPPPEAMEMVRPE